MAAGVISSLIFMLLGLLLGLLTGGPIGVFIGLAIGFVLGAFYGGWLAEARSYDSRVVPPRRDAAGNPILQFATTIGNVEAGLNPEDNEKLKKHEQLHVLQARVFGPLDLPLVGLGYVLAFLLPCWLIYHDRRGHPIRSFGDHVIRGAYPHVGNEEWAYTIGGTRP